MKVKRKIRFADKMEAPVKDFQDSDNNINEGIDSDLISNLCIAIHQGVTQGRRLGRLVDHEPAAHHVHHLSSLRALAPSKMLR